MENKTETKHWYVVYTKPQWERKIHEKLGSWFGIESWCPLIKSRRQWSDRVKILEIPLFRCYVFIRVTEKERIQALSVEGVFHCVSYLGKAAVIRDEDINELKTFLDEYKETEIKMHQLEPGKTVVVSQGLFKGHVGVVKTILKDKVILDMPQLRCSLEAPLESLA